VSRGTKLPPGTTVNDLKPFAEDLMKQIDIVAKPDDDSAVDKTLAQRPVAEVAAPILLLMQINANKAK
jgi:hypothetical protein